MHAALRTLLLSIFLLWSVGSTVNAAEFSVSQRKEMEAIIKDYLLALEYIARVGCPVIACLRGIGQHDIYRYQPDIADVQVIKLESTVPVVVDPSHMAGDAKYVKDLALQALAAGADGLLIEVSDDPQNERTDGRQAISPDVLADIIVQAR